MSRKQTIASIPLDHVLMLAQSVQGFRATAPGTAVNLREPGQTSGELGVLDLKGLYAHTIVLLIDRYEVPDGDEVREQAAAYLFQEVP